jgi:hypothetical protein
MELVFALSMLGGFILLAAWLVIGRLTRTQLLIHEQAQRFELQAKLIPIKTQAIERLVLFIERIRPDGLVNRLAVTESTAAGLQLAMLSQIRLEYEHNLAQQLYLSNSTWQAVQLARDEVIGMVHKAASITPPDASAIQFTRNLFKIGQGQALLACNEAVLKLKKEIHVLHQK